VELIPARPFVARKADFAPEARPGLFASIGDAIGRRSSLMLRIVEQRLLNLPCCGA
jgi:hypothetical protein